MKDYKRELENRRKLKKRKFIKGVLLVLATLIMFVLGITLGIEIGTYAVIDHIVYGLAGSTFIVNFNETRLVDQLTTKFIPAFNQSINENLRKENLK